MLVTEIAFGQVLGATVGEGLLHYVVFPLVVIAAVRFGQPATALAVLGVSAVAIWNTVVGIGPFASADVHRGLIQLQAFMAVLAGTGLMLSAAIAERLVGQRRRGAASGIGDVLAEAGALEQAAPAILRQVCENLEWRLGALWLVDPDQQQLRCHAVWSAPGFPAAGFEQATLTMRFARGRGLPGRVWDSGRAVWIEDVVEDADFSRTAIADEAGLHGAFAFPIKVGTDVVGVVEFFTGDVATSDADLLATMSTVGNQLGQFILRKRVESAVVGEQRRTRAILDTALDAVIAMDQHGVITEFNPAAERAFGYRKADVIGRELADLIIPPALRAQHRAGLARHLATGEGPFLNRRVETFGYHADGHEFPIEVAIIRISDGGAPRFTGFVRDLTERRQAEDDQKRTEELLRESEARLREADRHKDEFLAMLAHELRNPLAPIRTGLQLMRRAGDTADAVGEIRPMMERQVGHMVRLIDDLLDVSRISSGKIHLQRQPTSLASLVAGAVEANRAAIEAAGIQLILDLPQSPLRLHVDPTRFVQVVSNLLNNATKFTPAGGRIVVRGEVVPGGSAGELELSVTDTGVGISKEMLPLVFDLFTQAEPSTQRAQPGLGIGLALARRIVEMHDGRIDARSAGAGAGSEFIIRIPLLDAVVEPHEAGTAEVNVGTTTRKVLVVDDNADAADMLAILVRMMGGEAETAGDGPAAIERAAQFAPEVILMDIGMPGMDGYETCRRIRQQPFGRGVLMVALTGWGQQRDKERAAEAGFDLHLTKPADPADIERLLSGGGLH